MVTNGGKCRAFALKLPVDWSKDGFKHLDCCERVWTISDGETDFNFTEIEVTDSVMFTFLHFMFDKIMHFETNPEDTGLTVAFSLILSSLLEVDISGTDTYLEANVVINYGSSTGRRLLSVSRPLEPGSLSVGKKFQLYPVPCENPQTVPGRYVEEPCPFSRKTRVRICSKNGWETVVDDCIGKENDIQINNFLSKNSWGPSSLLSFLDVSHLDHADWQLLGLFTTTTCAIASLIFFIITKLIGQPEELSKKDSSSKHFLTK